MLGRFLSVDPIIQFPANSQSLNPYSYILNNPLSGTDPTGYVTDCAVSENSNCTKGMESGETKQIRTTEVGSRISKAVGTLTNNGGGSVTVSALNGRSITITGMGGNGASNGLSSIGANRSNGGAGGAPPAHTIGASTSNQVEVTAKASSQADNVPEGAAADAITRRVMRDFRSDESKPVDIDWQQEFMVVAGYDATRPVRDSVPGMPLDKFGEFIRGSGGDSSFAGSALEGAFYNIRGGPYSGVHQGSDVNYYHQGFVWAARGLPRAAMDAAIATHNLNDAMQARDRAERNRNLGQIDRARTWAGWGYDYYRERSR
jgi:hypothetical protein